MTQNLQEADWKHLRRIHDKLLNSFCGRINDKTQAILKDAGLNEHEKYLKVYKHIQASDEIVALCFNDWRRSTLGNKLICLNRHCGFTEDQLNGFTEGGRTFIKETECLWKKE